MNRLDRLTAILIQLQSKKMVKAQEIADRFEISLRTVYRDIRSLEEAGVPVGAEAGKGYFLIDGFHLPPVMFTRNEASALLIGAKLMQRLGDLSIKQDFDNALMKIKAVLRTNEKEHLEKLDEQLEILKPTVPIQLGYPNNFLADVQNALVASNALTIEYFTNHSEQINKRVVEPIGLYFNDHWHLIGFCRLRNDIRDFRLDRIRQLSVSPDTFDSSRYSFKQYLQEIKEMEPSHFVQIRFDKSIARYLGGQKYAYGFVEEKHLDTQVEMSFLVFNLEHIARWLLMFTKTIQIVKPDTLKTRMSELVLELKNHWE